MSDRDKIIEVMARAGATFEEVEYDKYRELFNEQAAHVLAALDAAGLAVVPVEPTTAMLAAGMTDKERASLRNWAESRVIDRSQKTRPLADVIAEARAALLTDGAEPDKP